MTETTFPNLLAVVKHLQGAGYKIAKSAAYEHQKQGKIRAEADGSFSMETVEKYARNWLKKADGSGRVLDEMARLQQAKLAAEAKRIQAQADLAHMKSEIMSGDYISRSDHETELAARAQLFKADLFNFARACPGEVIDLVGGNPDKAPELIEWLLASFEEFLDRYARDTEFTVGSVKE